MQKCDPPGLQLSKRGGVPRLHGQLDACADLSVACSLSGCLPAHPACHIPSVGPLLKASFVSRYL
eukprot:167072-Pelagomonas_calceolata.AAC.3